MISGKRADIIDALRRDIIQCEGFHAHNNDALDWRLGPMRYSFPNNSFPLGCVHEFLTSGSATGGFVAGVLAAMMGDSGVALWISSSRKLFPPALKNFGIAPDRFIFIDLKNEKDVLWAMDEALKCRAVTAVIGELREISFTASQRLQLAVEQSSVTGFILRHGYKKLSTTACASRWKISSLPSDVIESLPGIGFPKWRIELLRVRNGRPGNWDVQWVNERFVIVDQLREQYLKQRTG